MITSGCAGYRLTIHEMRHDVAIYTNILYSIELLTVWTRAVSHRRRSEWLSSRGAIWKVSRRIAVPHANLVRAELPLEPAKVARRLASRRFRQRRFHTIGRSAACRPLPWP